MKKLLVLGCLLSLVGCGQKEGEKLDSFNEMTIEEIDMLAEAVADRIMSSDHYVELFGNSGHEDQIRETLEQDIYDQIMDNTDISAFSYGFVVNGDVDSYYPVSAKRMK